MCKQTQSVSSKISNHVKTGKSRELSCSQQRGNETDFPNNILPNKGRAWLKAFPAKQYQNQQKAQNLCKIKTWRKSHEQLVIEKRQGWMSLASDSSVLAQLVLTSWRNQSGYLEKVLHKQGPLCLENTPSGFTPGFTLQRCISTTENLDWH